jgi:hypothetical protein
MRLPSTRQLPPSTTGRSTGGRDLDRTARPHLEHRGAEKHSVDSAEGPSAARGAHDLHTHDDLLREGGAHVRGKVLRHNNTAHNEHGYPHIAWGYSGAVSWCRGFALIRSPTEGAESQMRSEPNTFSHFVREPLSRHRNMDKQPYVCTPHSGSGDAPWAPCRVKSQARLAERCD